MSPGAYIALARDIGIVLALAFLVCRIYGAGENAVKASDLKSLQAQVAEQAQTLQAWRQESTDANTTLSQDLATLRAPTDPMPPVWLCNAPASPRRPVLSTPAASTDSAHSAAVGADLGSQRDIQPELEAFRLKYETVLAECRSLYSQWPKVTP